MKSRSQPQPRKQALRKITRTGAVVRIQIIQWRLNSLARNHGHCAPACHHADHGGQMRMGGMTLVEADELMLDRLKERIAERPRRAGLDAGTT